MGYSEARELVRIRQELRTRLASHRRDGAGDVLARLRLLVDTSLDGSLDTSLDGNSESNAALRSEYERWCLRFELLSVMPGREPDARAA